MFTTGLETACFQFDEERFILCKRSIWYDEANKTKLVVINHLPYALKTTLQYREHEGTNENYIVNYKETIKHIDSLFCYSISESTENPDFDLKPMKFILHVDCYYTVKDYILYNNIAVDVYLKRFLICIPPTTTFVLESDSYFINRLFHKLCECANRLYEFYTATCDDTSGLSFYSEGSTTLRTGRRLLV